METSFAESEISVLTQGLNPDFEVEICCGLKNLAATLVSQF